MSVGQATHDVGDTVSDPLMSNSAEKNSWGPPPNKGKGNCLSCHVVSGLLLAPVVQTGKNLMSICF